MIKEASLDNKDGGVCVLDIRVQTFLCVCRHMNFTYAAEELHITQPAVSQHIRCLEEFYGIQLFSREGKHVQLTPAGELFRATMTTVQNDEQAMRKRMKECAQARKTLTFGVTMTIGEYAITAPLARYLRRHPETDIHLKYGNTADLLARLQEGTIEFALVEGYFPSDAYDSLVYCRERYLPVCASCHQFVQPVKRLVDLLPERLLVREKGSGTRDILEKNLSVHNLCISDFSHLVEVENMHTMVSLLMEDCGVAFLYEAAVQQGLQEGVLKPIPLSDFQMEHDFTFLWNRGSAFSSEYEAICQELKET